KPVRFDHIDLAVVADGRHSVPTRIRLDVDGHTRVLNVPPIADKSAADAVTTVPLRFPVVTGSQIRFTIAAVKEERTRTFGTGRTRIEPVAVAEFGVPGVRVPAVGKGNIDSGCRDDLLAIDGKVVSIRIIGAAADAQKPAGLTITPCSKAAIALSK